MKKKSICLECPQRNTCTTLCDKVKNILPPAHVSPDHTVYGNVIFSPQRSIEQMAADMIDFDNLNEEQVKRERIDILNAMFVKILHLKDKRKKIRATRKYFIYICELLNYNCAETLSLLRICERTYYYNNKA